MGVEPAPRNSEGLGDPRIDNSQSFCLKWARNSRRDREMLFCCRSSNVSISLPDRLSGCSAVGHQLRVELRGTYIKGQNSPVKERKYFTFKAIVENGLTLPHGHCGNPETKFGN